MSMNGSFLPRNPSTHSQNSRSYRPSHLRKITVRLQSPAPHRRAFSDDRNHGSADNSLGDYEQGLQQRLRAAQGTQNKWYGAIIQDAHLKYVISQEHVLLAKRERDQAAAIERRQYEEAQRQRLETYQMRLAEEAERRRCEEERLQRDRDEAKAARRAALAEEAERRRCEKERLQRERDEAEAARLAALAAEAEAQRRQREEEERRRRERLRECAVCLDSRDMGMMHQLICTHWYCGEDLRSWFPEVLPGVLTHDVVDAFEIGWNSRNPFQCCQQVISPDPFSGIISPPFQARYSLWLLERATPNPVYCSNRGCGAFLPPSLADGPDAFICIECNASTCQHCQSAFHPYRECAADVDTQQARALAATRGWKACPTCRSMVEKSSGCLHMTCRCGTEFCYRCGQLYSLCTGNCRS